jgi:sugar phosphate permease
MLVAYVFTMGGSSNLMKCRIAEDFGASNEDVALIPTLAQAGYAIGSLFISPLGDLIRRRQLVLLLVTICGLLSIGLALARSVAMLQGLTFVVGITTVRVPKSGKLIDR